MRAAAGAVHLGEVRTLARRHPAVAEAALGRPPLMWRELLLAAACGDAAALGRARLRGQSLLAAETRAAAGELRRARGPLPPRYAAGHAGPAEG